MQSNVQWLKGYCGIYTGWCAGPNTGDIWVKQVVTNLPDGFYTIEGRMFAFANDGNEADLNQYVFIQCGDNMVKANNTTSKGYWSYYGRGDWTDVTTDFIQVTGGTVTLGYHHNSMALNTGVTFRYYGETPDYSKLVNDRIAEVTMPVEEQIAILYCGTHGLLRNIPLESVHDFEAKFLEILRTLHRADVLDVLKSGKIDDNVTKILDSVAANVTV